MKKILFIDVDGTLVTYEAKLPDSAVEAIRLARRNGHRVYMCTGRSTAEMPQNILDIGYDGMGISITGSFLSRIISSPYCPEGLAYILDMETVKLWVYSNADKIDDKQGEFDTVKEVQDGDTGIENRPYQLLVDDLFTLNPAAITQDGAGTLVLVNFLGEFVVTEPCKNAVVHFA